MGCATAQRGAQAIAERIPYDALWPDARDALIAWLEQHHVDPRHTPVDAAIALDENTGEWRIEQHATRDERLVVDPATGDVPRIVIRRLSRAPLPWPEYQPTELAA
ncbi:hypothetical protein [Catenuloplanes atrovinosus]|uniref:Uncharacterized protein n=1 Tax=Catenuloplanes atrovinosus TaxID=137266 RepID=A0AAE3YV00_9ACTN|nr:hypothetical protein [Catenuloplanes atrovinosus]MDR7278919.1 hypothetical protein [Catenuloplanes atrovinosus]